MNVENEFSPYEQSEVDEIIREAEATGNDELIVQALVEISNRFEKLNLPGIEAGFRRRNSNIFLIAVEMEGAKDVVAVLPHTRNKVYPYGLSIVIGDHSTALDALRANGSSPMLNMMKLRHTGIGAVKVGSELERKLAAPWN